MKTKSKKKSSRSTRNPAVDLFDQVPVSEKELELWVAVVAPRWHGSRRMQFYIRDWDIAGKVACAKRNGTFDQVLQRAAEMVDCGSCIGRFAK